jgi:hypothetical protein
MTTPFTVHPTTHNFWTEHASKMQPSEPATTASLSGGQGCHLRLHHAIQSKPKEPLHGPCKAPNIHGPPPSLS